jgi:carboxylesterase
MGGTLVLRMALDGVPFRGVVPINHALWFGNPLVPFARWLHPLVPSTPAIASDIADPTQRERAYDRTPTAGVAQLHRLAQGVRQDLPTLRTPLLLFRSRQDHVLPLRNATRTLSRAGSPDKELVWLERSFHVATQDFDRDIIANRSLAFFQRLSGASA